MPLLEEAARAEGGTLRTVPREPQCCQVQVCIGMRREGAADGALVAADMAAMDAARDAVDAELGVRVYHRLAGAAPLDDGSGGEAQDELFFEWVLGPAHVEVADAVFVDAWAAFFRALKRQVDG